MGGRGGWNFEILGDEVDHKNKKGDLFSDFAFYCKIQNTDFKIEMRISQLNPTLAFVHEEARLLIADEDDQFFFQIGWVLQMCQDFKSQDYELIIFSIVSTVSDTIAMQYCYCIQAPEWTR